MAPILYCSVVRLEVHTGHAMDVPITSFGAGTEWCKALHTVWGDRDYMIASYPLSATRRCSEDCFKTGYPIFEVTIFATDLAACSTVYGEDGSSPAASAVFSHWLANIICILMSCGFFTLLRWMREGAFLNANAVRPLEEADCPC